jgi:hypothetical protein
VAHSDCRQAETLLPERRADVGLDRVETRGPQAAAVGDLGGVARGAQGECHEIMHVHDDEPAHIGVRQQMVVFQQPDIACEHSQCFRIRDRVPKAVLEPRHAGGQHLARYADTQAARERICKRQQGA